MNKTIKLYTSTGDAGQTSLIGGRRVPKTDQHIEVYGTIDELNATLGVLLTHTLSTDDRMHLLDIQQMLFDLPLYLSQQTSPSYSITRVTEATHSLENHIDAIQHAIPMPNGFVLPGGTPAAASAHISRTTCRRLERLLCHLSQTQAVAPELLAFVNRLSDYLFVLALKLNYQAAVPEILWEKRCSFKK